MPNPDLAQWLQDHTDMLGRLEDESNSPFHTALYESIIEAARTGNLRMADSVVESAAAHAVAVGRSLSALLRVPHHLRQRLWERIGTEVDPEPGFEMLYALNPIFDHIAHATIESYQAGAHLAHTAQSVEISRRYSEAEEKVMQYAAEVARANRELARLDQAKTDFISIAAHELKTPLTLIQGYVNILHELDIDPQTRTLTTGIDRGVERINSILEDMLDLSALDLKKLRLALHPTHLHRLIELVMVQAECALAERRQTISAEGLADLPPVEVDVSRLHQVFKQLVNNAIKYTPDGGQILIAGQVVTDRPHRRVRIIISDTGVGISPEDREKIFEKFYRAGSSALHSTGKTKFMGAGPGLGLAIVKGLIEAHGGTVRAESPGFDRFNYPGSKFTVELPVKATPAPGIGVDWIGPEQEQKLIQRLTGESD